ncbi:hypothetical protein CPB83DRAFT_859899 [Crepidotus variabilis]|uniref:Uncharacterized protein n=1 Tax=Crepidotus variabilis TaxID=179855 RepID=A0A9P6JM05_9AGAR|nr:hypothetical protein CPB83DRAFT_859899 [Crepidotus variabilis]
MMSQRVERHYLSLKIIIFHSLQLSKNSGGALLLSDNLYFSTVNPRATLTAETDVLVPVLIDKDSRS